MFRVGLLELRDFRSYREAHVAFCPGLNVIQGRNGQGKTNLLEAIHFAATLRSLRSSPTEALVSQGAAEAVVRIGTEVGERSMLVESSIAASGRHRTQLNRRGGARRRDLADALQVVVFSPDDLELVKGPPGVRREVLDDLAVGLRPGAADDQKELDRVLRQRNALLKQSGGRVTPDVELSLEVWDERLVRAAEAVAASRVRAIALLAPHLVEAYRRISGEEAPVEVGYDSAWIGSGMAAALVSSRRDDLRRGVSTVGPHRDDMVITLADLPARTHASQGEQRCIALALRLASHQLLTDTGGHAPVLLLDDVFSELDSQRSAALFDSLPDAQILLATAAAMPDSARPDAVFEVVDGSVVTGSTGGKVGV